MNPLDDAEFLKSEYEKTQSDCMQYREALEIIRSLLIAVNDPVAQHMLRKVTDVLELPGGKKALRRFRNMVKALTEISGEQREQWWCKTCQEYVKTEMFSTHRICSICQKLIMESDTLERYEYLARYALEDRA